MNFIFLTEVNKKCETLYFSKDEKKGGLKVYCPDGYHFESR